MKKNNIVIAPQIESMGSLYTEWSRENYGTEKQFYEFLTTPSMKRSEFLTHHNVEFLVNGEYLTQNYSL